jgi:aconitase A
MPNSFGSLATLSVGGKAYSIHRLAAIEEIHPQAKTLPFSLKVLLENLLRNEDSLSVRKADIEALAQWQPDADPTIEINFTPARVLMQDFTGVPCVVGTRQASSLSGHESSDGRWPLETRARLPPASLREFFTMRRLLPCTEDPSQDRASS